MFIVLHWRSFTNLPITNRTMSPENPNVLWATSTMGSSRTWPLFVLSYYANACNITICDLAGASGSTRLGGTRTGMRLPSLSLKVPETPVSRKYLLVGGANMGKRFTYPSCRGGWSIWWMLLGWSVCKNLILRSVSAVPLTFFDRKWFDQRMDYAETGEPSPHLSWSPVGTHTHTIFKFFCFPGSGTIPRNSWKEGLGVHTYFHICRVGHPKLVEDWTIERLNHKHWRLLWRSTWITRRTSASER